MKRAWRHVLVVIALIFAQQAALVHSLRHLNDFSAGKDSVPGQHLGAKCLAFHAVDSALPCARLVLDPPRITPAPPLARALPLSRPSRTEFDSRAPPRSPWQSPDRHAA